MADELESGTVGPALSAAAWRKRLRRLGRALYLFPWFTLLLILLLTVAAWWIGVRTTDPPTNLHSLGVVAQVPNGNRISGQNLPSGARCAVCASSANVIRYAPGAGLRVDMVIKVHPRVGLLGPSCGNATVDMVISGTEAFWLEHNRIGPRLVKGRPLGPSVLTKVAIGWDGSTHIAVPPKVQLWPKARGAPALAAFFDDPQSGLHPGFYTDADLTTPGDAHQTTVQGFPSRNAVGLRTQIFNWGYTVYQIRGSRVRERHCWPLQLHFVANWVQSRGWGSCYVLIPSLLANGAFAGTEDAIRALFDTTNVPTQLLSEAQPPSYGRIALAVNGSLSLSDTSPAPTDFEAIFVGTKGSRGDRARQLALESGGRLGPVWACQPSEDLRYLTAPAANGIPQTGSFAGDACGAIAVVYAAGANDFRAVFLIVIGVLIALACERFFRKLAGRQPEPLVRIVVHMIRRQVARERAMAQGKRP
jgi:hypothetical protein